MEGISVVRNGNGVVAEAGGKPMAGRGCEITVDITVQRDQQETNSIIKKEHVSEPS
jgi:hypothetical protein